MIKRNRSPKGLKVGSICDFKTEMVSAVQSHESPGNFVPGRCIIIALMSQDNFNCVISQVRSAFFENWEKATR